MKTNHSNHQVEISINKNELILKEIMKIAMVFEKIMKRDKVLAKGVSTLVVRCLTATFRRKRANELNKTMLAIIHQIGQISVLLQLLILKTGPLRLEATLIASKRLILKSICYIEMSLLNCNLDKFLN